MQTAGQKMCACNSAFAGTTQAEEPRFKVGGPAANRDRRPAAISAMAGPDCATMLTIRMVQGSVEGQATQGGCPCSSGFRRKRSRIIAPRNGRGAPILRRGNEIGRAHV